METYQLTRSKRKSLSIVIGKDGAIQVKAPNWLPKYQIDQFVRQKAGWIEEKRSELYMLQQNKPAHTFQEGDSFQVFGEAYRLTFQGPGKRPTEGKNGWQSPAQRPVEGKDGCQSSVQRPVEGKNGHRSLAQLLEEEKGAGRVVWSREDKGFILEAGDTTPQGVKKRLEQWYIHLGKQVFPERVSYYYPLISRLAESIGKEIAPVNRITIRSQKTRWGSCSSKGNLNFNWRLLMAPAEILDYVVVHELCHLLYLNHSRQFWQAVGNILPDYPKRRSWLKANGMLLEWEES